MKIRGFIERAVEVRHSPGLGFVGLERTEIECLWSEFARNGSIWFGIRVAVDAMDSLADLSVLDVGAPGTVCGVPVYVSTPSWLMWARSPHGRLSRAGYPVQEDRTQTAGDDAEPVRAE